MTKVMLSKSTRLNRIAEVRCLQGFRAARTFEPSAPDWLCLGRATSDESVWIPPGYLRTNGVFCTCKSSQPDRTVRKQQITQVNSRWVVCVFAKRASDTIWRERFWKVIYHNKTTRHGDPFRLPLNMPPDAHAGPTAEPFSRYERS
jgi:hypothetical protein